MNYLVSGHTSNGPIPPSHHETAESAFYKAIELMTHGLTQVEIVDPMGRCFRPAEFVTELNEQRTEGRHPLKTSGSKSRKNA